MKSILLYTNKSFSKDVQIISGNTKSPLIVIYISGDFCIGVNIRLKKKKIISDNLTCRHYWLLIRLQRVEKRASKTIRLDHKTPTA